MKNRREKQQDFEVFDLLRAFVGGFKLYTILHHNLCYVNTLLTIIHLRISRIPPPAPQCQVTLVPSY
jgi:hypothetical protein